LGAFEGAAIPVTYAANHAVSGRASTVVFSSYHANQYDPTWLQYSFGLLPGPVQTKVVEYMDYVPIVLRQTMEGHRVDWNSDPTRSTMLRKIRSPQFQNVVFAGHGDNGLFGSNRGGL